MLYYAYTFVVDVSSAEPFTLRGKMPGWDLHSYGYHSDDGGAFHNAGSMLYKYGKRFIAMFDIWQLQFCTWLAACLHSLHSVYSAVMFAYCSCMQYTHCYLH
jgi:hypothetical protein